MNDQIYFPDCKSTPAFAFSMFTLLQAPSLRAHVLGAPNHNPQVVPMSGKF